MMRAKRWIPPEMPQMPVCQAYVEGQRALQGSWERGRHIRSCAIRRDRELNIAKSNMWLLSGGKTRENSLGLWRSTVWSGQRSQTTSKCSRLTDTRGKMEIITHAQCKYVWFSASCSCSSLIAAVSHHARGEWRILWFSHCSRVQRDVVDRGRDGSGGGVSWPRKTDKQRVWISKMDILRLTTIHPHLCCLPLRTLPLLSHWPGCSWERSGRLLASAIFQKHTVFLLQFGFSYCPLNL